MNFFYKYLKVLIPFCLLWVGGCKDLDELNINPNGANPETIPPEMMLTQVLSESAKRTVELGFGDVAGVMQHTQKDAWFVTHNDYEWSNQTWTPYYDLLKNNQFMYQRAVSTDDARIQGMAITMKCYLFGLITDLWGDIPYSEAINGATGDEAILNPAYDPQQDIYLDIIDQLKMANALLYELEGEVQSSLEEDIYFGGNIRQWRQFANSLQLRYLMRISEKLPALAQQEFETILSAPSLYPLVRSVEDEVTMDYVGTNVDNSWPSNTIFDSSNGSNFRRIKMCSILVNTLQGLNDPRLSLWAAKVEIPLSVDSSLVMGTDTIQNGIRYLSPDMVEGILYDTDSVYVGLPPSVSSAPSTYNLNPTPGQLSYNPHVSYLHDRYQEPSGDLLKARLLSASETLFLLSEAAWKGWNIGGSAETYYNQAVTASLTSWELEESVSAYLQGEASFQGTLEQIMEQKWIAGWTNSLESWFDFRRTGLPQLKAGPAARRSVLPVRFYYTQDELTLNASKTYDALTRLQITPYSQADGYNSGWSKPWLLQDTGKPW